MKKKRVLILSGIYWDETWQRHQKFAEYFAKMDYEVYFVEHIISSSFSLKKAFKIIVSNKKPSEKKKNPKSSSIEVVNCGYVNPGKGFFKLWNIVKSECFIGKYGGKYDIIVNYLPINTTRYLISRIKYKTLIYDCVRNFEGWTATEYPKDIEKQEKWLVKKSDLVFTDSFFLTDKMKRIHGNVFQFLPSIDSKWKDGITEKEPVKKIKDIAYFGNLSREQNDIELYKKLSKKGFRIHFWGSIPTDMNFDYEYHGYETNLTILCRDIIESCDAILLAYKGMMDGVIPAKIMQALSTGLPVFVNRFYDMDYLKEYLSVFESDEELLNKVNKFSWQKFLENKPIVEKYLLDKFEGNQLSMFENIFSNI